MFSRLLLVDLQIGILHSKKKYLFPLVFLAICYLDFFFKWRNCFQGKGVMTADTPSLGDAMLYFFGGCDLYVFKQTTPFIFPVRWLLMLMLPIYLNMNFLKNGLSGIGLNMLVNSKKRYLWWLEKNAYISITTMIYHIISTLFCTICSVFSGAEITIDIHIDKMIDVMRLYNLSVRKDVGNMILLYFLFFAVSDTLCHLHLLLCLFVSPISSFVSISSFLLLSSYAMSPFLFANYAMPVRSLSVSRNGIEPIQGLILMASIWAMCSILSFVFFDRKDILERERGE